MQDIPKSCKECFGNGGEGKYKLPSPYCSFEIVSELKELEKHFKGTYNIDLAELGLDTTKLYQELYPKAKECLHKVIPTRIEKVKMERNSMWLCA